MSIILLISFQTWIIVDEYLSGNTVVRLQDENLPAITVCHDRVISMKRAAWYNMKANGTFMTYLEYLKIRSNYSQDERRKMEMIYGGQFINDLEFHEISDVDYLFNLSIPFINYNNTHYSVKYFIHGQRIDDENLPSIDEPIESIILTTIFN